MVELSPGLESLRKGAEAVGNRYAKLGNDIIGGVGNTASGTGKGILGFAGNAGRGVVGMGDWAIGKAGDFAQTAPLLAGVGALIIVWNVIKDPMKAWKENREAAQVRRAAAMQDKHAAETVARLKLANDAIITGDSPQELARLRQEISADLGGENGKGLHPEYHRGRTGKGGVTQLQP